LVFKKKWLVGGDSIKEEERGIKEENRAGGVLQRKRNIAGLVFSEKKG
jgi:hypothetical protein